MKSGTLAIRALNQYRRRDVLSYLGLRYYLENSAARTDEWVKRVTTSLVLSRSAEPYLSLSHFKEMGDDGRAKYRLITIPGPNEALAETLLLHEAARHSEFRNPPQVYSYHLCATSDARGSFEPYMGGLQRMQRAVANACEHHANGIVRFIDIRGFYPSISTELARQSWSRLAGSATLPSWVHDLAERMILDHGKANVERSGQILTGPMLSHLLGNVVLRDIDTTLLPGLGCFAARYVDDFVLVGAPEQVQAAGSALNSALSDIGLSTHEKLVVMSTTEWLTARHDYAETDVSRAWKRVVWDMKRFVLVHSHLAPQLREAVLAEGFRLPVRDYSTAVREAGFIAQLKRVSSQIRLPVPSLQGLMSELRRVRSLVTEALTRELAAQQQVEGFQRRRRRSRLRYYCGRALMVTKPDELVALADALTAWPELRFQAALMKAVATGDMSEAVVMGANVAQAAAQAVSGAGVRAHVHLRHEAAVDDQLRDIISQGLAMCELNGLRLESGANESPLWEFARFGGTEALMQSREPFIRELACLHGRGGPRHANILGAAFAEDEDDVYDAIELARGSWSL